jgi:glycosyltransferase involved in cell wall biosynthesis
MVSATALILTYNEEENIGRTLGAVSWINEVVIIDSGSTDRTLELARSAHPNVRIVQRTFDTHAKQWNFGLSQIQTPWVLTLDADYEVSAALADEIKKLQLDENVTGYEAHFEYRIYGRRLRSSVYPPRVVLFRTDRATYFDDGHTQRLRTEGLIKSLTGLIYHDDRKPMSHWFQSQKRYARLEARQLIESRKQKAESRKEGRGRKEEAESRKQELSLQDRLRLKIFFAAPMMFFYLLFGRGLILDGWPGWFYVYQRTIAELLLSVQLVKEKLKN